MKKNNWDKIAFGDVVNNLNLTERDPIGAEIERIVGLEHLDPENLHIRRWNNIEDGTSFSKKFVPGQTLFGKRRAYQKKVAYAEFEAICSGDILVFESKDPKVLLPELLPFICQTDVFFDYALGTSAGSLSPRTSWTALKEFKFPLPPLPEQKRIAEILWAADEAVEKCLIAEYQLIFLKNQLSKSLLETVNGNGTISKLGDYIELISGQHITAKDYKNEPPGFPYITGPADFPDGKILVNKYTGNPKVKCRKGDILVTCKGSGTGKSVEADQDYCISRQLMAVRPTTISPILLKNILSAFNKQLNREAKGLIPGISRTDILDKKISIPSGKKLALLEKQIYKLDESMYKMETYLYFLGQLRKSLINKLVSAGESYV